MGRGAYDTSGLPDEPSAVSSDESQQTLPIVEVFATVNERLSGTVKCLHDLVTSDPRFPHWDTNMSSILPRSEIRKLAASFDDCSNTITNPELQTLAKVAHVINSASWGMLSEEETRLISDAIKAVPSAHGLGRFWPVVRRAQKKVRHGTLRSNTEWATSAGQGPALQHDVSINESFIMLAMSLEERDGDV